MLRTALLLFASNIFMTFAWYAHLRNQVDKPLWIAILSSWGIAFFEYCLMVPANRHGYAEGVSLSQLKILQEVVTLTVFAGFSLLYMRQPLSWNYLGAGVCMCGAAWFMFRG